MNRTDHDTADTFTFLFEGNEIKARPGDTVAAALLANGVNSTRTTRNGSARGPFCMMGACYDCLIEYDGTTLQSCMTEAMPDMEISMSQCIE